MKKHVFILLTLLLVVVLGTQEASAQCAMCKAVAESGGANLARGLNSGILYLMSIPYILLIGMGVLLFRKARTRLA